MFLRVSKKILGLVAVIALGVLGYAGAMDASAEESMVNANATYNYDIAFVNPADNMPARMTSTTTGSTVTLPTTTPTMSGYKFDGWCSSSVLPGAACTGTTYAAGSVYTLDASTNNDVTLYAIWGEQPTMQDFSCSSLSTGDTVTLSDARDGITYNVGRLADGKCWMLDNLAFNGKDNQGNGSYITMDSTNTHINTTKTWNDTIRTGWTSSTQNTYTASYINDASKDVVPSDATSQAGQYKVGVYYNYCAATLDTICSSSATTVASYDVCPKGWKLPAGNNSSEGFSALAQAIYGSTGSTSDPTAYANYRAALRLPLSGYFSAGTPGDQGSSGWWWSTAASDSMSRFQLYVDTSGIKPDYEHRRWRGSSIRCISSQ